MRERERGQKRQNENPQNALTKKLKKNEKNVVTIGPYASITQSQLKISPQSEQISTQQVPQQALQQPQQATQPQHALQQPQQAPQQPQQAPQQTQSQQQMTTFPFLSIVSRQTLQSLIPERGRFLFPISENRIFSNLF